MFVLWKFYTRRQKVKKESKTKKNLWFLTLYNTCKVQVETLSVTTSCQTWSGAKVVSRTSDSARQHSTRSQILAGNRFFFFASQNLFLLSWPCKNSTPCLQFETILNLFSYCSKAAKVVCVVLHYSTTQNNRTGQALR